MGKVFVARICTIASILAAGYIVVAGIEAVIEPHSSPNHFESIPWAFFALIISAICSPKLDDASNETRTLLKKK